VSEQLVPSIRPRGDRWYARVVRLNGIQLIDEATCDHQHKEQDAAKRCAERMAEKGRLRL
jgi:hypothetical protein